MNSKSSSRKPILVISAHWDTKFPYVNIGLRNSMIHDFYGFAILVLKVSFFGFEISIYIISIGLII
ncbi:hypothetical protein AXX17_AT3G17240 [Arabidopsis thaliana]|uniref:Uncharacterized protein n=1 Tax=Arabidopsis thaliana TaxID=3702 RepID=A0A178VHV8_ARATH|nr:hypothetical protein AXX17_AT3G17240 [Arabidopsis thaliana]